MNPTKLNALLKKAPTEALELPEPVAQRDPVAVLVFSFLLWEASTSQAIEAFRRIQESMVDFNDVRVSLPRELIDLLGPRYPRADERARRLRASLNEVFKREHAVKFPLAEGKRDIKAYVESIEGMVVPYVATRLLLICFGVHGVPVDEQTRATLAEHGLCDPDTDLVELAGALARHVKAEQTEAAHAAIQSLVDAHHVSTSHAADHPRAPRRPASAGKPQVATQPHGQGHGPHHLPTHTQAQAAAQPSSAAPASAIASVSTKPTARSTSQAAPKSTPKGAPHAAVKPAARPAAGGSTGPAKAHDLGHAAGVPAAASPKAATKSESKPEAKRPKSAKH